MFEVRRYGATGIVQEVGTAETILEGGDLFHLISSSVPLDVKFYNAQKSIIGRVFGVTSLKLNFFDGLLMRQSLDRQVAVGNNLPDMPQAFYFVGITAASPVSPEFIITKGGVDSESFEFAGNVSIAPRGSVLGRTAIAMANTDTQVIAANAARTSVMVVNAATSGAGALWVSDTAAISDGAPVFPGAFVILPVTGALEVYSDGANILAVLEIL